jgi:hypothetical protein
MDRLFRKYDYPSPGEFDRNARRVVAGIERLFYVTPYQLNDLLRAIRNGDNRTVVALAKERVQELLERLQIGEQALGAEALRELVEYYVIGRETNVTTDSLREQSQIQFLATTTNLTTGCGSSRHSLRAAPFPVSSDRVGRGKFPHPGTLRSGTSMGESWTTCPWTRSRAFSIGPGAWG